MNRRRVLAGISAMVAGLSGCTSRADRGAEPREERVTVETSPARATTTARSSPRSADAKDDRSTPTARTTTADVDSELSERRTVSLASIDREPVEYGVSISVDVLEPTITSEHTARVRATLSNDSDSTTPSINLFRDQVVNIGRDFTYSVPQVYVLVPPEQWYIDQPNRCWTPNGWGSAGGPELRLRPGESVTQEFLLGNAPTSSRCMPPGDYHFGGEWPDPERSTSFRWLFTLSIEK